MDETGETGTFAITKTTVRKRTIRNKYADYKSFICALLAFLAVLILISTLMYAMKYFGNEQDKLQNENLFGNNSRGILDERQKYLPAVPLPTLEEVATNLSINVGGDSAGLHPIINYGKSNTNKTLQEYINKIIHETHDQTESTEPSYRVQTESLGDIVSPVQSQPNEETTTSITTADYLFKVIPYNHTVVLPDIFNIPTTELPETKTTTDIPSPSLPPTLSVATPLKVNIPAATIHKTNVGGGFKFSRLQLPTPAVPPVIDLSTPPLLQPNISNIIDPKPSLQPLSKQTASSGLFGINPKLSGSSGLVGSNPKQTSSPGLFGIDPKLPGSSGVFGSNPKQTSSSGLFGIDPKLPGSSGLFGSNPKQTSSSGLFGIDPKPLGKIVNKQLSAVPGLTIRTVNSPPVCLEPVCKGAAASMLAMKNHADQLNYCEDYYSAICQKPEIDHDQLFFRNNFRGILKALNSASEKSVKYFNSFYKQCNDYGNSINRINRINALKGTGGRDVEDAIVSSILTQSMPFFDVGINILNNKFVFEMTLPGLNYLKTNIQGWSLRDQFRESCIAEVADGVTQNVIELDSLSNKIEDCINDVTSRYLSDFLRELEPISKLPGMSFLGGVLTKLKNININPFGGRNLNPLSYNPFGGGGKSAATSAPTNTGDSKTDLVEILKEVQNSWTIYRKARNPLPKLRLVSIRDLTKRYNLDINWADVLQELTKSDINDDTKIYFSEYLDQIFKLLVNKKNNLREMLDLWYNVQIYKNTVIEKQLTNRPYYCMDLIAQLMPEVSSSLVSDLNKNRNQLYDLAEGVLRDLKQGFQKSLSQGNFSPDSIQTMENRLNQIRIARPNLSAPSSGFMNLGLFDYWSISGTYQDQLVQLIKHYKKMLFDQVSKDVTGEALLRYFVFAFDTEPKTYPPYREIVYQPGFTDGMAKNLPNYVRLAKQGLPLATQLSKHFVKNDFIPNLNPKDAAFYDDLFKSFDTKHLVDKSKYNIEYIDCEVEDLSGKNFKYASVVGDNLAFRLVSDIFTDDPMNITLPFTNNSQNETFIAIALQDFCKKNDFVDFIGDFYNMELPAPIKVRNMALNSEWFAQTYGCSAGFNKKQFPFINRN